MNSQEIKNLDKQSVMQTYGRFDIVIDHGKNATLYTPEGKEYIDFTSGIGVNSVGCANPEWINAVTAQAGKIGHISNLFYTEPYAKLASLLKERTGMSNVFFSNSGAESNEGMIKLARKYSFDKYGNGRSTIITLVNSFHGRTVTTLAATGQDVFHNYFFPFTEGFKYAKANDIESVKSILDGSECAIMMELIQGEGGVNPLQKEFVKEVSDICKEKDLLLLIDEVQTGVGRTGSLFAFQQYDILPDVCSFAKGIAGGLPLGGFMANEKCRGVLVPGTHATTFGGNPICCAAGAAVLNMIDEKLLKGVQEKGEYIKKNILAMDSPYVDGARGLGLMIGIGVKNITHKALAGKLIENGLLVLTAGSDTLRLLPPLTITYEEIDKGLAIFKSVLEEMK